ncbi:helicase, partial [Campylobacter jejuni]|nr:helicase [Campylobacter jejuni]
GKYYEIQSSNEAIAKDFIIFKDDNSDSNKARQKEIELVFNKNIETLSKDYQKEYKIFEYKGLLISGEKTSLNTLSFYISTLDGKTFVEPENLVYKQDSQLLSLANEVNFRGFMTKVNNFYNNLDKFISQENAQIQKLELEITELKSITGDNTPKYKRKDYLEALREDNRIVMEEIEKMSKQKDYKSSFMPKSTKFLEELNKQSKTIKENAIDY